MVTKINFNNSSLQNSVLPYINNSIDILNSIINVNSQLDIPRGFNYYNSIKELQNSNINTKNSLIKIKDYIVRSNRNFDSTIDEISSELRSINNVQIGKRESSIK